MDHYVVMQRSEPNEPSEPVAVMTVDEPWNPSEAITQLAGLLKCSRGEITLVHAPLLSFAKGIVA